MIEEVVINFNKITNSVDDWELLDNNVVNNLEIFPEIFGTTKNGKNFIII